MSRPKYAIKDKNHSIVPEALAKLGLPKVDAARLRYSVRVRGQMLFALDISGMPGQIDWLILSERGWFLSVEVKQRGEEHKLTEGEKAWRDGLGIMVATNSDAVKYAILELIGD